MKKYTPRKDGRYGTKVWDGSYKDGKKRYIDVMASSSKELEQKVKEIERKRDDGKLVVSSDVTLIEYARNWLKVSKSVREKATIAMYKNIVEHKLGVLGSVKVSQLSHSSIQGAINEIAYSPRTCQIFMLTLKQILKSAEKDKIISKGITTELLDEIQLPKYKAKERRPLTDSEIEALKNADFTDRERLFVYILYGCGLRREEAIALSRFDINLKEHTISINKAIGYDVNRPYLKDTKSDNGVRVLPIPPFLEPILESYLQSLEGAELFTNLADGKGYLSKTAYTHLWAQIIKKMEAYHFKAHGDAFLDWDTVGIKGLTAHIFRHNYCTKLCYESIKTGSISTKKIAELLGDTEAMVLKVYSHILEEQEKPAEAVNSAIVL